MPFRNSHKDALCAKGGFGWKEVLRGIRSLTPLLCIWNSLGLYQSLHSPAHPSISIGGRRNELSDGGIWKKEAKPGEFYCLSLGKELPAGSTSPAGGYGRLGGGGAESRQRPDQCQHL